VTNLVSAAEVVSIILILWFIFNYHVITNEIVNIKNDASGISINVKPSEAIILVF
jgi:hypothetical protein